VPSNIDYGTDPSRELAQWLQEVARRRYPHVRPRGPEAPPPPGKPPENWRTVREAISFAALAAAYLQYHMLEVMLEIASMKTVTVFV
jgi:hypothetical protein